MTYEIPIPEELRDYMQRLTYEINARKDLLAFFLERGLPQRDLFNEYHNEYERFCMQYELAKEEIAHDYICNKHTDCNWNIDYTKSAIIVEV